MVVLGGSSRCNFIKDLIDAGSLLDLGYKGQCYTWARKENGIIILQERLDRSLVNEEWLLRWPDSSLTHLARMGSDHNPLLFNTSLATKKDKPIFRFDVNWADDDEAKHIVEEYCWTSTPGS